MKSFGIASAVATVLGGVALFASTVNADVDPIVIKVRVRDMHKSLTRELANIIRVLISSTRAMEPNFSSEVLLTNKMSIPMALPLAHRPLQIL
jgi:hypothetical protein